LNNKNKIKLELDECSPTSECNPENKIPDCENVHKFNQLEKPVRSNTPKASKKNRKSKRKKKKKPSDTVEISTSEDSNEVFDISLQQNTYTTEQQAVKTLKTPEIDPTTRGECCEICQELEGGDYRIKIRLLNDSIESLTDDQLALLVVYEALESKIELIETQNFHIDKLHKKLDKQREVLLKEKGSELLKKEQEMDVLRTKIDSQMFDILQAEAKFLEFKSKMKADIGKRDARIVKQRDEFKKNLKKAFDKIKEVQKIQNEEIDDLNESHGEELVQMGAKFDAIIFQMKQDHESELEEMDNDLLDLKTMHENEFKRFKEEHQIELDEMQDLHETEMDNLHQRHERDSQEYIFCKLTMTKAFSVMQERISEMTPGYLQKMLCSSLKEEVHQETPPLFTKTERVLYSALVILEGADRNRMRIL